jgi:phage tail-like protein
MSNQTTQFPGYAYIVSIRSSTGIEQPLGGFTQTNGLSKIQGLNKSTGVTLKRGVVDASGLADWINATRGTGKTTGARNITITLRDPLHIPLHSWSLSQATPTKFVGPPLSAKSGEVALEELVLSAESIEIVPPH